ncbi:hypothetical protein NQ317_009520 [Molorchus minor]|uniref:Arrestin C-terminal-like domain-containing protein n=1 Tax=Molorchus minor TaxID=1323400 RepID=A0ABQ9IQD8_9CUCU|nr:hypothetical protein NQ317_009520 [Molorchus minor]
MRLIANEPSSRGAVLHMRDFTRSMAVVTGCPLDGRTAAGLSIVCHEHTEWMDTENYYDTEQHEHRSRNTLFKGDNDAFITEFILYGNQSSTTSLSTGQHIYPFSINLPNILPGTFNCEHGSISYKLIACVDRPMAFDYQDEIIFVVVAPIDLNLLQNPRLLEPTSYSEEKTVCCWCCARGLISLDVQLPKRTLVPGETINISVRLSNMSNSNIEGLHLRCHRLWIYVKLGLGAHGEHTYSFSVMLPNNVPHFQTLPCASSSKVEYIYRVEARLPSMHTDLKILMYPEVGHIQIKSAKLSWWIHSTNNRGICTFPGIPTPHHPPVGGIPVYPSLTPTAPFSDNSKYLGNAGEPNTNIQSEQPPPSYDSLRTN